VEKKTPTPKGRVKKSERATSRKGGPTENLELKKRLKRVVSRKKEKLGVVTKDGDDTVGEKTVFFEVKWWGDPRQFLETNKTMVKGPGGVWIGEGAKWGAEPSQIL